MTRGPNEKAFLELVGIPNWCGESEAREALYGYLVGLLGVRGCGPRAGVIPVPPVGGVSDGVPDCPRIDSDGSAVVVPGEEDKMQEKAKLGARNGKPGRKPKKK